MKVTKKVGRRSRSSISRRRFRSKKNKKSSYKKRYGKTHRGGCWKAKQGGARSRKYGHKRGKRFHRGGVLIEEYDLNSVLLEYKKNDGKFLTTSDTKMFKPVFFQNDDPKDHQLKLTRCSGKNEQSCSVENESYMSFKLGRGTGNINGNMSSLADTLENFVNGNSALIVKGYDKDNNATENTYILPASTLNKKSFILLKKQVEAPTQTSREKVLETHHQSYIDNLNEAEEFANQHPDNKLAQAKYKLALANLKHYDITRSIYRDPSNVELQSKLREAEQALITANNEIKSLYIPPTIYPSESDEGENENKDEGEREQNKRYENDPTLPQRVRQAEVVTG
jgi:hypothetical protein